MAKYEVNMSGLLASANSFENYMRKLERYSNRVDSIRSRLSISGGASIRNTLRTISDGIDIEAGVCRNMSSTAERVYRKYESTENNICGNSKASWTDGIKDLLGEATKAAAKAAEEVSKKEKDSIWDKIPDSIYKTVIAAVGPVGVIVDTFRRGGEGHVGKVIGNISKLIGGAVKNSEGSKVDWKKWMGWTSKEITTPWKDAVGKYFDFSDIKKGVSSACNWIAAGATSLWENWTEHGKVSARFLGESITETALAVGEGILMSAAVGGAIALAGVSAPAWAVAAGTALVTVGFNWAADKVATWLNGGEETKWKEAVSDWVNDGLGNLVDGAVKGINEAGKAVSKTIDKAGKAISKTIDGIGDAICGWKKWCFG